MKNLFLLLLLPGVLFFTQSAFGQGNANTSKAYLHKKKNHQEQWEAGILGGISYYNGDLNTSNMKIANVGGGGGLFTRYNFNDVLYTRANLQFGSLKGADSKFDDIYRKARNFSFTSTFYDFGLLMEVEPFGKKRSARSGESRHFLSPYFHFGISGVMSKPLVDFNEPNIVAKQSDIDIDKNNTSFFHVAIPVGVGVRYDLNDNWMLGAEAGVRRVFTDYLDGISVAGNPARKDWFETANLVIGYRFAAFRDKDGDGIPNDQDACPLEPGTHKSKGCPDRDKDGVPDKTDRCPDVAGTAKTMGCPDADGDGIEDKDDDCPFEAGLASLKGCPDTDDDGITDKYDKCPDVKGVAAESGCPDTDSDKDGIADYKDKCPDTPGIAAKEGCPDTAAIALIEKMKNDSLQRIAEASKKEKEDSVKKDSSGTQNSISFMVEIKDIQSMVMRHSEQDLAAVLSPEDLKILKEAEAGLFFDSNKSTIKPKSYIYLDRIVDLLKRNPNYLLRIVGHTDNIGKELQNVVLSVARAHAVYDYLVDKGINFKKLSFMGAGSTKPAADNATPEGRAKNRRAEIQIITN